MSTDWTEQDEQVLKALRRRKAKHLRDAKRQRKYSPRLCSSISEKNRTFEVVITKEKGTYNVWIGDKDE